MKTLAFKDLGKRLGISALLIALIALLLAYANRPLFSGILGIVFTALGGITTWEYQQIVKKKAKVSPEITSIFSMIFIATVYLSSFFQGGMIYAFYVLGLAIFFIWTYYFKEVENAIFKVTASVFPLIYIAVPLSMMLLILYPPENFLYPYDGRIWLAYLLAVTKMADVGAYFLGKLFGSKKLSPHISPGKTRLGTVGGLLFSLVTSLVFYYLSLSFRWLGFEITLGQSIWLGILLGALGVVGDLAESLFKRDAKVKDSNMIPGLGGFLDMLDSLLFTAPFLFFYLVGK